MSLMGLWSWLEHPLENIAELVASPVVHGKKKKLTEEEQAVHDYYTSRGMVSPFAADSVGIEDLPHGS